MALVFKMTSSAVIGASGAGIGYEGIANSLVVEFDTYQNTGVYSDPWHDHIAILENGIAHHSWIKFSWTSATNKYIDRYGRWCRS